MSLGYGQMLSDRVGEMGDGGLDRGGGLGVGGYVLRKCRVG